MTIIVTSMKTNKDTHSYLNLLLILTFLIVLQIDAYPVDSRTLALGRWYFSLHRLEKLGRLNENESRSLFDSLIFPIDLSKNETKLDTHDGCTSEDDRKLVISNNNEDRINFTQRIMRRLLNRGKMDCTLDLLSDGTFILDYENNEKATEDRDTDELEKTNNLCQNEKRLIMRRQPIKGRWRINANPYCITDRQYDDLQLTSYPRTRQQRGGKIDQATLDMKCKMWGRYGSKSIRDLMGYGHGRSRGRLTHGTLSSILVAASRNGEIKNSRLRSKHDSGELSVEVSRNVWGTFRAKSGPSESELSRSVEYDDESEFDDDSDIYGEE